MKHNNYLSHIRNLGLSLLTVGAGLYYSLGCDGDEIRTQRDIAKDEFERVASIDTQPKIEYKIEDDSTCRINYNDSIYEERKMRIEALPGYNPGDTIYIFEFPNIEEAVIKDYLLPVTIEVGADRTVRRPIAL